jgi:hypothetical protein
VPAEPVHLNANESEVGVTIANGVVIVGNLTIEMFLCSNSSNVVQSMTGGSSAAPTTVVSPLVVVESDLHLPSPIESTQQQQSEPRPKKVIVVVGVVVVMGVSSSRV